MKSAGLLPFRYRPGNARHAALEAMIAHPGGPFWAGKDEGAWSIVKGLIEQGEDARSAAAREFAEETGWHAPAGAWIDLGEVRLRSGKVVAVWAAEGDYDPATLQPGTFTTSLRGRQVTFPEIDRVEWHDPATARRKLNPAYAETIDRLERQTSPSG